MMPTATVGSVCMGVDSHNPWPYRTVPHVAMGNIIDGYVNILVRGKPAARAFSVVINSCGSVGYVLSASMRVIGTSGGIARVGDPVLESTGMGTIITGDPTVLSS